jgi:AAA domain
MTTKPAASSVPGVKCLIFGRAGSGKTYATRTLFNIKGLEVFHIFLEPSQTTIGSLPNAHYAYINPFGGKANLNTMQEMFKKINTLSNDDLQKASSGMASKREMTQMLDFLNLLNNYTDQNGEVFGDVATWGTNRVLVVDGLTGLTHMARNIQSGLKPLLTQPDFGVIMNSIANLLEYMTHTLWCHLILIAHIEQERDEITGRMIKSVSTIGRKLAPTIPPMFDDVVMAYKEGGKFMWSTVESDADTKNRTLPLNASLEQNFETLFESWQESGGVFSPLTPGNQGEEGEGE